LQHSIGVVLRDKYIREAESAEGGLARFFRPENQTAAVACDVRIPICIQSNAEGDLAAISNFPTGAILSV
jgi:hypothetical protein